MHAVFKYLWTVAYWSVGFIVAIALCNLVFPWHESLWAAALQGTFIGLWMSVVRDNNQHGWIRGIFRMPESKAKTEQRRRELGATRERAIEEA